MSVGEMVGIGFAVVAVLLLVREWLTGAESETHSIESPDAMRGRATR